MEYRKLGNRKCSVSLIGLGTMTWGEQNTESEAHAQIDYALDHGVNLIDAAEMYPVPPRPETQGSTERYIGTWLAQHPQRARKDRARHQDRRPGAPAAQSAPYPRRRQSVRPQESDRSAERQPQAPANRLHRSVPVALARSQHDDVRPPGLSVGRRCLHGADRRNAVGAGRIRQGRQDSAYRRVERNAVGCRAVPARGGEARLAAHRQHSESVQPGESHVRSRACRSTAIATASACSPIRRSRSAGSRASTKAARVPRAHASRCSSAFSATASRRRCRATSAYVALAKRHGFSPAQFALAFVNSRPFVTSTSDRRDLDRAIDARTSRAST